MLISKEFVFSVISFFPCGTVAVKTCLWNSISSRSENTSSRMCKCSFSFLMSPQRILQAISTIMRAVWTHLLICRSKPRYSAWFIRWTWYLRPREMPCSWRKQIRFWSQHNPSSKKKQSVSKHPFGTRLFTKHGRRSLVFFFPTSTSSRPVWKYSVKQ